MGLVCLAACSFSSSGGGGGGTDGGAPDGGPDGGGPVVLRVSELMASNDGAWIDQQGEVDDWLELVNASDGDVDLGDFEITDGDGWHVLPARTLAPGEVVLLWADDELDEGDDHLPFELDRDGERVVVRGADGTVQDDVTFPALETNIAYARYDGALARCAWATPTRANGDTCGPVPPPDLPIDVTFEPYDWPVPWPPTASPLAITELALEPAAFIEVMNTSAGEVDLAGFTLQVSATGPGAPWPAPADDTLLAWPAATLAAGARAVVAVTEDDVADIAASTDGEGVVTLYQAGTAIDRVDFMSWPAGAALARAGDTGALRFCATATPGAANTACDPLASRPTTDRDRHFYTAGDFDALAAGSVMVGIAPVKFVVDMQGGDAVHLLGSDWDLHYTFIREYIDGEEPLDRCDPTEAAIFRAGWGQFSQEQYYDVENRRYLLGTLEHHLGSDMHTVEFTTGDAISADQMHRAFTALMARVPDPSIWALRPQSPSQVTRMQEIEGTVPIVPTNAPFNGVTLQLLSEGLAYGVLTFVPADQIGTTPLGPQVVVVTDRVPNDIPLVGGLITEDLQTPLAHVNVLSRNRGTPNIALVGARDDERIAPLLGELVRFEVTPTELSIELADPDEAEAYWASQVENGPPLEPGLDTTLRGVQPLADHGFASTPALGAKAAQLAELGHVSSSRAACPGALTLPEDAAAIPLVHSLEHYDASGASALLAELEADSMFVTDPVYRAGRLAEVRALVLAHPVDPELLADVTAYVDAHWGAARVRFRSSSNTEDLPGFNGAGLYTSVSGALDDPDRPIEDSIRTVWASLYSARAYDERRYGNVEESLVGMGVLMHPRFGSERANLVAISRNIADPVRGDHYTVNAQFGEAGVVNPAPGITTDRLIYRWGRTPRIVYQGRSNLPGEPPVLTDAEIDHLTCQLRAIHDHLRPFIDPELEDRWYTIDTEAKLVGPARTLVFKQARPYTFGAADMPDDCREF